MDGSVIDSPDADCERDDPRLKPIAGRSCGVECPLTHWSVGEWGVCDKVCAPGKQTRTVSCVTDTTPVTIVTDSECAADPPKPDTQQDCDFDCQYITGRWGDCSVSCGRGTQRRSVQCQRTENGGTRIVTLRDCEEDASQIGSPPSATRNCNEGPCGKFIQSRHELHTFSIVYIRCVPMEIWRVESML